MMLIISTLTSFVVCYCLAVYHPRSVSPMTRFTPSLFCHVVPEKKISDNNYLLISILDPSTTFLAFIVALEKY